MLRRTTAAALCVLALAPLLHGANACADTAAQDPFTGTWKLNLAKSTLPQPSPQSLTSYIECDGTWLSVREEIVDAEGQSHTVTGKAAFDGKDYPVVGRQHEASGR